MNRQLCAPVMFILAAACGDLRAAETVGAGAGLARARSVAVEDVVEMNRIGTIVGLSPDKAAVAVVLWRGNLKTGANDYSLMVYDLTRPARGEVLVTHSTMTSREAIAAPKWLADGSGIAFVAAEDGQPTQVFIVDRMSREVRQITDSAEYVLDYDLDRTADVVAYTTRADDSHGEADRQRLARTGFPISPRQNLVDLLQGRFTTGNTVMGFYWPGNRIYVKRGTAAAVRAYDGRHRYGAALRSNYSFEMTALSLSPDGRHLIAAPYLVPDAAQRWMNYSPRPSQFNIGAPHTYALIDLSSGDIEPLLDAPKVWGSGDRATWSVDSTRVTVESYIPLSGASDREQGSRRRAGPGMVEVDIRTRQFKGVSKKTQVDAPEVRVVQSLESPPELGVVSVRTGRTRTLTDLNPQFRALVFGKVEKHTWKSPDGLDCAGYLVRPVDYRAGVRYPTVFMVYPTFYDDQFVIEGQVIRSAMAPQPLAGKGIASVLLRCNVGLDRQAEEYQLMQRGLEAGIRYFRDEGTIDAERLGLVGWSRSTGWVKHMVVHSVYRFAGATAADGVGGHYMYYAAANNEENWSSHESFWGASPSSEHQGFLGRDPALNARKIRTPLMLTTWAAHGLLGTWDLYAMMRRHGRPVEFYYYPETSDELKPGSQHNPVRPLMRQADLQRNVDWFSFWLKDEIDPDPAKREQFERWKALKEISLDLP